MDRRTSFEHINLYLRQLNPKDCQGNNYFFQSSESSVTQGNIGRSATLGTLLGVQDYKKVSFHGHYSGDILDIN